MRLGEKVLSIIVALVLVGYLAFPWSVAEAELREIVSMSKSVSVSNYPQVYDSISLKIKTSQPFKVSVQVSTSDASGSKEYWINYSSAHTGSPSYDEEAGTIEAGMGSDVTNGQWNTVELNIRVTLEEEALNRDQAPPQLNNIKKISILGSDFGIRYINVFYTASDGSKKYQPLDKANFGSDNFGLPDIEPPSYQKKWRGWDLVDPDYFSIQYQYDENLTGYLQGRGALVETSSGESSSSGSTQPLYSPTDAGSSYYSPYSATGGYYDNFYGPSSWYGGLGYYDYLGYGGLGLGYGGFGMGYGGFGLGGLYGYGLGGYGYGLLGGYGYPSPLYGLGYGLGGYGLPYSSYGYPYSLYGGALGSPLGLDFSSLLTGAGVGTSPLLAGVSSSSLFGDSGLLGSLADLPTNTISIPTLVPSTNQVSLSSILGLGDLGITGLSDVTIPVTSFTPGSTSISVPALSSFLPSTSSLI